jgi:hypothetical protein
MHHSTAQHSEAQVSPPPEGLQQQQQQNIQQWSMFDNI